MSNKYRSSLVIAKFITHLDDKDVHIEYYSDSFETNHQRNQQ